MTTPLSQLVSQVSLVPTSGYRGECISAFIEKDTYNGGRLACTATPIEITYHEEAKYIAKVAFLSRHEWETELRSLLDDFRDEEGNTVDLNRCSEAAKAARDKVRLFESDTLQMFDIYHHRFPLSTPISRTLCIIERSSIY